MRLVSADLARRLAVRAQLLDGSAIDVLDTVRRLGRLQLDLGAAADGADLQIGPARAEHLDPLRLDHVSQEASRRLQLSSGAGVPLDEPEQWLASHDAPLDSFAGRDQRVARFLGGLDEGALVAPGLPCQRGRQFTPPKRCYDSATLGSSQC